MGAGCFYTNKNYVWNKEKSFFTEENIKAVWYEVDSECEYDYSDSHDNLMQWLKEVLNVTYSDNKEINTPLYKIWLESTYEGNGLIIKQESLFDSGDLSTEENKLEPLARLNFEKNYYSMVNKLVDKGIQFKIATSGYTSAYYQKEVKK